MMHDRRHMQNIVVALISEAAGHATETFFFLLYVSTILFVSTFDFESIFVLILLPVKTILINLTVRFVFLSKLFGLDK